MRRKLFAYTMMYTAGISAGFFIFERTRIAGGALIMLTSALTAAFAGTPLPVRPGVYTDQSCGLHNSTKSAYSRSLRIKLTACLTAGFVLFTIRYLWYGTAFAGIPAGTEASSAEMINGTEALSAEMITGTDVASVEMITGTVSSVTVKDSRLKIVITDTDAVKHGIKVLVSMKITDDEQMSAIGQESGCSDSTAADAPYYDREKTADLIGRRITAYGRLREPPGADNPGCFDYRIYLRSRGIGYIFNANAVEISKGDIHFSTGSLRYRYLRMLFRTREGFLDLFDDPEIRGFVKGTVFGDKSDISEEVIDDFTRNGTGHILAVSGLHTGFLYALLRFITGRRRTVSSAFITAVILIMYGDMTMWSPSTMRAVTVLMVSMMSVYVRRPFDLLSSVSAAAFLILTAEPYQLFSTGFQMSFLALLGIAFLAGPIAHFTGNAFAVMLSVQIGIVPVSAFVFHRANLLSIFVNVPVIFLASLMVPASMTALFIFAATGSVPGLILIVSQGLCGIIIKLNNILTADGYFSNLVTSTGAGTVIFFYLSMFMISSEWVRIRVLRHEYSRIITAMICIAIFSASAGAASYNRFADDEIVFVSVGQGDCTHIRAGERDILIDGGGSTERNTGKDVLMPYLLANGAENTELALVTHLHTDHYLGIAELEQIYPVGAVGIPSDYRKSVEDMSRQVAFQETETANTSGSEVSGEYSNSATEPTDKPELLPDKIVYVDPRSRIDITADVYIEPIWPPAGAGTEISIDDPNEHNMVYMVHYSTKTGIRSKEELKIMVTGDLLEEEELKMIDYYSGTDTLKCDVLKIAHHGSKSSSSDAFLDAASPSVAVIQVGLGNWYGHPHAQTLERLEERGIRVYRTDLNGAVGIDIVAGNQAAAERIKVDLMRD